jgi:hypothetical protein
LIICCFIAGCTSFKSSNSSFNSDNTIVSNTHKDAGKYYYVLNGVPVLMYHSIGVEKGNPITMPKQQFEAQIKFIKENSYTT